MADRPTAGRLQDRVAIVTGGASGIGASTVARFLAEGASVVAADLNTAKGDELLAACAAAGLRHLRSEATIPPFGPLR